MLRLRRSLVFLLVLVLVGFSAMGVLRAQEAVPAFSSPQAFPAGARAYGMGGAFVAVADDASALYWNPAGLADSRFGLLGSAGARDFGRVEELSTTIDQVAEEEEGELPDQGVQETVPLSALVALTAGPVGLGAEGQGWIVADLRPQALEVVVPDEVPALKTKLDEADVPDSLPAGTADVALLGSARLGLGFRVLRLGPVGSLALGVAGSYHVAADRIAYHLEPVSAVTVDVPDPDAEAEYPISWLTEYRFTRAQGYGVDLGLKARVTPWITLGAVAHDVVSELTWEGSRQVTEWRLEVSGNEAAGYEARVVDDPSDPEPFLLRDDRPPTYQVGIAVAPPLLGLTLAADLDSEHVAHLGAEWRTFFGILALRAGYVTPLGGGELAAGYGAPVRLGLGLGLPFLHLNAGAGFNSLDDLSEVQDAVVELSLHF